MTDTIEVEKWRPVHGGDAWVRVTDYDALAAKLADAERVARYESDIAQQALDRLREVEAELAEADAMIEAQQKDYASNNVRFAEAELRAKVAEARIAHLENHIEGVAKDTHKIMVAYATAHAAVLGVAQTLEDAYWSREEKNDD